MKIKGAKDTIDWYDKNADQYSVANFLVSSVDDKEQIEDFEKLLFKGAKILDVGCGPGRDSYKFYEKGLLPVGIDLSSGLIKIAKKKYPEIEFTEGNMISLPFKDLSFDGLWCHASLLHLEKITEVKKALKEFFRVLKSDGVLHVLVKAQTDKFKTKVVSDSLSNHDRFFRYFKEKEIIDLVKNAGFEIIISKQYKETDRNPNGRSDVEWIVLFARKNS